MKLGELIKALEARPSDEKVVFNFAYTAPTKLASWRGIYAELALGWEPYGYSNPHEDRQHPRITVAELLEDCRSAVGKEFQGWKGGEYVMSENTVVHVDNPGDYSTTDIIAVTGDGYETVIVTSYRLERA